MLWSFSVEFDDSQEWHAHEIFQLLLCREESQGVIQTASGEHGFAPERTILIPPNTPHRFLLNGGCNSRLRVVCFPSNDLVQFLSPMHVAMLESLYAIGVSSANHAGAGWVRTWDEAFSKGLDDDDIWAQRMHWGTMGLLLTLHAKQQERWSAHPTRRRIVKIKEIVGWIEENLTEGFTIDQTAERFGISRSVLTRELRSYTGKSFVEYCNSRRVQKAAVVLANEDRQIAEVAHASGFENLSHFHRQFKTHLGLTPATFRKQIREAKGL